MIIEPKMLYEGQAEELSMSINVSSV